MVCWYESLLLYIVSLLVPTQAVDPSAEACLAFENDYVTKKACECVVFQSYGLSEGRFNSPMYPSPYKPGINCILYTFIGDVNEIVRIKFLDMDLKAPMYITPTETECRDRLRIFKNLDRPEVNEDVKHQTELCGNLSNLEKLEYFSSGRALIMEFHTDADSRESHSGFKGVYTFLEKSAFKTDGILQYGTQCSYDIQSGDNRTKGRFFSPRYPQEYSKSANCRFNFMGHENEIVKVLFKLIRLPKHSSRSGCDDSGDVIKVFDGRDSTSKLLKSFCDTYNQIEMYSTGPYMYIEFHSDRHHEKQGFAADYEFMDVRWPHGTPVPGDKDGTIVSDPSAFKCNHSISSNSNTKNGTIYSPLYPNPYPSGIICQFEFQAEGQERIQLKFTTMDLYYSAGDPSDPFGCPSQDSIKVFVYIDNREDELGEWCGKKHPQQLMSNGQKMKVVFRSEASQKDHNSGFSIEYSFRTDFGVLGNGVQDERKVCTFTFRSTLQPHGYFTSPNFGGQYPRNTECVYLFIGRINEVVEISFAEFDVDGIIPRCDSPTDSDYVAFSNFIATEDRKLQRYCGNRPSYAPVTSDAAFFRVTFKSNQKYDANGFKGIYKFEKIKDDIYEAVSTGPTPKHDGLSGGTRSSIHIAVAMTTIILVCNPVIDLILTVF